ncbi:MAG TPA: glycosyltransferase family 39 protein [Candidatus Eisenbacteria bacterium]|nr:glycosyltransferase family 39 protein [Candidatus Eisenbacteria bacterium]
MRRLRALLERDRLVLPGLLAIAAATRLPGLAARGRWEGDQGTELMTLWRFTHEGVIPLVGPVITNGPLHHGVAYYYLLAPFAAISGPDPLALVGVMAAFGIATVWVTWSLATEIGGRLAGLIGGLFMAVSPAAIEASTFLWNANLLPFFAGLTMACAWHARRTGRVRWWVAALASAGMVLQLHVLGAVLLPAVVALFAFEVRRARRETAVDGGDRLRRLLLAGLAGAGLIAVLFIPLLVHELQTGFLELQRLLPYLRGSGEAEATLDPPARLLLIVLRVVGWPLVGLITDSPMAATLAVAVVIGLAGWQVLRARGEEAIAVRWLAGTVAWSCAALTFAAPSLQFVVPGLPNDHYHAFLDPIVIVLLATGAASLAQPRGRAAVDRTARSLLAVALVALLASAVSRWPPAVDPNGGWPAARTAGVRMVETTERAPTAFVGLPRFEAPDGAAFPFVYAGGTLVDDPGSAGFIVVPCNRLFDQVLEVPCGGPAEDRLMRDLAAGLVEPFPKGSGPAYPGVEKVPQLIVRFDLSPRTSISIYRPG